MVDTSPLIKDERDVLSTKKLACLINDQLAYMAASAPPKSTLWRIFHEFSRLRPEMMKERAILGNDQCLLPKHPRVLDLFSGEIYLVNERWPILASMFMFESIFKKMWLSEKIYEYSQFYYYNGDKARIGRM